MSEQKYPFMAAIYKGEGRILIIPYINHMGGYLIQSEWFAKIENMNDCTCIGESILSALKFIESSPISCVKPKEFELNAAWKKNSKYKSWYSFWKNNSFASIDLYEDGHYEIRSMQRSEKRRDGYDACIKKISLPHESAAQEIGAAVIDVYEAEEEFYKGRQAPDPYPAKTIRLIDESELKIKPPRDIHFQDCEDAGAAEIYQCYCYLAHEGEDSSADFFIGIAPELDCNLTPENVRASWEKLNGKADIFEVNEAEYGLFRIRTEMRNKNTHKISYFIKQDKDLILECGMEVHQPYRRKKFDEKMVKLFEEFALNCKK